MHPQRDKAVFVATIYSNVVGIGITLFIWGRIGFDVNQLVPVLTMILLCFGLTGIQVLLPVPTYVFEFLVSPRQLLTPIVGALLMRLFDRWGVDYSVIGAGILQDPNDCYLTLGMCAGYLAAQVYVVAALVELKC